MIKRVLKAWLLLLYIDGLMRLGGFNRVHKLVRQQALRCRVGLPDEVSSLSHAVDLACVFYFKQALCLQRSAALALLMRRSGLRAELIIGAKLFPFQSHAWVEADGRVVNDKEQVQQIFQVLERC